MLHRRDLWFWVLVATPGLLTLAGCGGGDDDDDDAGSSTTVVTTDSPAAEAATTAAPAATCAEHTGESRYGSDCAATKSGGYCLSSGNTYTAIGDTTAVCTSSDRSGCTLTNAEACPCSCADEIALAAADNSCGATGRTTDLPGQSRYGDDCAATAAGGYCTSGHLSWTKPGETGAVCTQDDRSGCKLKNAEACCESCAPSPTPPPTPATPAPTVAVVDTGYGYGYGVM